MAMLILMAPSTLQKMREKLGEKMETFKYIEMLTKMGS